MKRRPPNEDHLIRSVALRNAHSILAARQRAERELREAKSALETKSHELAELLAVSETAMGAQARLAAIVASSHDAIISKDVTGKIISWNEAAELLYGYTESETIGQSITLLVPPDRLEEEAAIMARLLRGEKIEDLETVRMAKDGRLIDVSVTVSPVRDSTGRVVGASKIARDITARIRADEELRDSEAQFRQLASALPQIVWTARSDGYIDYYNDRWYDFTGFERDGRGIEEWKRILHADHMSRFIDEYYACILSGNPYQIEYRFADRRSGGYRWFLGRAYPVRDVSGAITRWFGSLTDIDDTKRAEEVNRFLADASATLSGLTDQERALTRVVDLAVPIFADWCAVDIGDVDGKLRRLAITPPDAQRPDLGEDSRARVLLVPIDHSVIERVFTTGVPEWIADNPDATLTESPRADDDLQLVRLMGVRSLLCCPLRTQAGTHGVITFATAQSGRAYSAGDLVAAEDLANRAAISIENASLLAALKEGDRRKDEFLAMLAHELRNPLAPIRNALHIIRMKAPNASPQVQWARDVIERQVLQLNRLVDDLLDVSRITRGKIELRKDRIDLATVINSAVEASRPVVEKLGHHLTVALPEQPVWLDADLTRISQVLSNLLNNAAKYTRGGGNIGLMAVLDSGFVVLTVKDDGIGISTEMLPRIFEMFTQADSSLERSQGGLGIGLTLVQLLVELHGGSVEAHSEGLGTGSEFVVRLPTYDARSVGDESASQGLSETLATLPKHHILVVDDNQDAAESLAILLQLTGSEVHTAHDGLEAVDAASVYHPDVAIVDIGLPRLNGYDVARRLRDEHGDRIFLIALTGWGQDEDRRRSLEAGFDYHLTKPIGIDALKSVLAMAEERGGKGQMEIG